jgi:hypothetical protein
MRMLDDKPESERLVARKRYFERQLDFYENAPQVPGYTAAEHANLTTFLLFDGSEIQIHIP